MNKKKDLYRRKHIVELIGLILAGINTNKEISEELKKSAATISERIDYLKNFKIIWPSQAKKHNETEYNVDCSFISERFVKDYLQNKALLKYKDNDLLATTFGIFIFSKKELKEVSEIILLDIFLEVYRHLIYRGRLLIEGKNALEGYTTKNKNIESDFKEILKIIYKDFEDKKRKMKEEEEKEGVKFADMKFDSTIKSIRSKVK